mgnify:CR=1 FL=1
MTNSSRLSCLFLAFLLAGACAPHRPWDRSVPASARVRWRLGQDIFASVARDVKLMAPLSVTQAPAVRRAAEAALTTRVDLRDDIDADFGGALDELLDLIVDRGEDPDVALAPEAGSPKA